MKPRAVRAADSMSRQPIAITGMACIFPGAANLQQYWNNITNGVCALSEVPESRWESVFFDPESSEPDRFYCRTGGFVDDYVDFDPLSYGIMPKAAESADPDQLLSLRVGVEALQDAGLWQRQFSREKTGVIIGRGNYLSAGTLRLEQHVRLVQQTLQTLRDLVPDISEQQLAAVKTQIKSQLNDYGPDTAVGLIPNLVASRLANRLDLNGPAYTVDAACASALIAIEQSCQLLRRGEADVMLSGGLHFTHDLTFWATFCQLGALSRSGMIRPFSSQADGILAGEGIGMLVLRRLDDAISDGDRIYAVIHGVGSASDGKSSSLLAPAVDGQLLALQRAWQQTDLDRRDIGLLEAHGTGTPAGDNAELETLAQFFGAPIDGEMQPGLGSVKSMIGHTMPAAGAAGLIKAALAVYHGVLPTTLQADSPNPLLEKTRFRLLNQTESWKQAREQRVAAVNAFGFGGINAHVVIGGIKDNETVAQGHSLPRVVSLACDTQQQLLAKLDARQWDTPLSTEGEDRGRWRLAIVDPNPKRLGMARSIVEKGIAWHGRNQIYFSADDLLGDGKIAFLFPGVDSSFNPRVDDVAAFFDLPVPKFAEQLDPASDLLKVGLGLTGVNKLLNQVLRRLQVVPSGVAGHSVGEWSAMAASGCLSQALIDEVNARMDPESLSVPNVLFLAVASGLERLQGLYEDLQDVYLSHDNCPHQVIFCGRPEVVEVLAGRLQEQKLMFQRLPIVSGFHSPLLAEYARPFTDFFTTIDLAEPEVALWSANTASEFPRSLQEKRSLIVKHLLETVRFRELITNMYADGYRGFIQVGVGSLPGFVDDTLKASPHLTLSANIEKRSGMEQLCHVLAGLWVEGYQADVSKLGLATADVTAEVSAPPASKTASTMRLQLGVPLIRFSEPLALSGQASTTADSWQPLQANPADPLAALFQQTLDDIQMAGEDIHKLWEQHVTQRPPPKAQWVSRRLTRHLDVNTTIPFVLDHAFYPQRPGWPVVADRHPVIPLTMELSLMRSAVSEVLPDVRVVALENVRAFSWLIVDEPVDIEIVVEQIDAHSVNVAITGYAEATAIIAADFPTAPAPSSTTLVQPRETEVSAEQLYRDNWMFHGPAYQSITHLGPIGENGIQGRLTVSSGEGALLDNMGQLAGYWVMEQDVDCLAMPIGIGRINFYAPDPTTGEQLDCSVWIQSLTDSECKSDLQLIDDNGAVLVGIEGWHTRRYSMDKRFWIHSKQVHKYLMSETTPEGYVLFEDHYGAAITRDYLAKRYLNQPETAQYNKIAPKRKRQWLNGRVAVKDAIRHYLWSRHGHFDFWPKEIAIDNNDSGQPVARAHISDTLDESIHISLAHRDHLSVAVASDRPVGIDIELIEPRSDTLIDAALTMAETEWLSGNTLEGEVDEKVTRIWAAKEAVAKMQGTGLEGKPKNFVVEDVDADGLIVNGQRVSCTKYDNYIICWTYS